MPTIKLVVIGPSGVGKTSLRGQYISGRFSTGYRATIGADFISKTLPHPSNPSDSVTLQIWDTAGQERFSSLSSAFFRGADAALLMFDVHQPATLHALTKWWDEFRLHAPVGEDEAEAFCIVAVGNKIDLDAEGRERIGWAEAERFVDALVPPSSSPPSPIVTQSPQLEPSTSANGNVRSPDDTVLDPGMLGPLHPQTQTQSLDIVVAKHRLAKSRSRSSSRFYGGTLTSTYTFHTAASSFVDSATDAAFESALSSPVRSLSPNGSSRGSPRRRVKRSSGSSSSDSGVTITPSLYHANATAATTPEPLAAPAHRNHTISQNHRDDPPLSPLPPPPLKRPKLFFTSAKTGEGVADVFEYIAQRVVRRWEWEEAVEARVMHVQDTSADDTIKLGSGSSWRERGREVGGRCC